MSLAIGVDIGGTKIAGALVRDGDVIELDIPARRLELRVGEDELARRRAAAPDDPDLALLAAELLDRAGKHADALKTYEAALKTSPDADATP